MLPPLARAPWSPPDSRVPGAFPKELMPLPQHAGTLFVTYFAGEFSFVDSLTPCPSTTV
jgi:hypothetical protein